MEQPHKPTVRWKQTEENKRKQGTHIKKKKKKQLTIFPRVDDTDVDAFGLLRIHTQDESHFTSEELLC